MIMCNSANSAISENIIMVVVNITMLLVLLRGGSLISFKWFFIFAILFIMIIKNMIINVVLSTNNHTIVPVDLSIL